MIVNCVEFYHELNDESCFVALGHLENLKKAQSSTIISGEEAKAKALGGEFQYGTILRTLFAEWAWNVKHRKLDNQPRQDNMISKESQLENLSSRNTCLSEVLEVLQEPKFKVLESEFQLSKQFLL